MSSEAADAQIDLDALTAGDLEKLAALDAAGLPAGPGEDFATYRARLEAKRLAVNELERELAARGEATVFDCVTVHQKDRIPGEIIAEGAEITGPLYDFEIRRFPGFFLSRDVGLLWGGCLICDTEHPLAIFLIRSSFRKKKRFFIYRRQELLAHELCHSVRQELHDVMLEEFFAYQTSPSRLRRYLGNCFIRERDALLFTIPALLLLAAQMLQSLWLPWWPVWPFWIPALGYPAWLLIRNARSRREYFRAVKRLKSFGVDKPGAVLFRVTADERRELGSLNTRSEFAAYLSAKCEELRWQVIRYRFLRNKEPKQCS